MASPERRQHARPFARDLIRPLRRAIELHLRGDIVGAERRLRAVIELEPRLAQAHHHLAVVLHAAEKTVEAVRHMTIALDLDPDLVGGPKRLAEYRREIARRRAQHLMSLDLGSFDDDEPRKQAG